MRYWYAVQREKNDAWDNGSHDKEEAIEMLKEQGCGLIAVIDEEDNFCTEEIPYEDVAERSYVIADSKQGDLFFDGIDTTDRESAIEIFRQTWNALSDHDKKLRDYYELLYAYGNGCSTDIETAELVDKIV